MLSIAQLEAAARSGSLEATSRELLESMADPRARAHLAQVFAYFDQTWTRHPEALAADLYRTMVGVEGFEVHVARWVAELDARGPWLRSLRPAHALGLARLHTSDGVDRESLHRPVFLSDDEVAFFAPGGQGPGQVWSWARREAFLAPLDGPEPARPPVQACRDYPELAALFCPPATKFDPPWPDLEHASFRRGKAGERLLVYGPRAGTQGSLIVLDGESLEILLEYALEAPVLDVLDQPGSDTFVVVTANEVVYCGLRWRQFFSGGHSGLAWSPSGRYLCFVTDDVAELYRLDIEQGPPIVISSVGFGFSPSGHYLLEDSTVYGGVSGEPIMELEYESGTWLAGGPPSPTVHIGDELLLCFPGSVEFWEIAALRVARQPEDPVPTVSPQEVPELMGAYWHCVAYDAAGRCLAMAREGMTQVELIELPSGRPLTSIEFDLPIDHLALSWAADLVAALSEEHVEVRRRNGEQVFWGDAPVLEDGFHGWSLRRTSRFLFSADASRLALDTEKFGAHVWELPNGAAQPRLATGAEFDRHGQPPPGWQCSVEDGLTTFIEESSGRRVAVSVEGPWHFNPAQPQVMVLRGHHLVLEGVACLHCG